MELPRQFPNDFGGHPTSKTSSNMSRHATNARSAQRTSFTSLSQFQHQQLSSQRFTSTSCSCPKLKAIITSLQPETTFEEQQKDRNSNKQLHALFFNSSLKNSYVVMEPLQKS